MYPSTEMTVRTRLIYLFFSWIPAGLIYIAGSFVRGNMWIIPESSVEQLIPFSPHGIWLYLFFYIYIPYTFLTVKEGNIKRMSFAFIGSVCISGIFFIFLPSSIVFPDFELNGISAYFLSFVSENDTPQNCFPSIHASLITVCTLANWDKTNKARSYGCILLTIMMYYSIIQLRRHICIDVSAGIILALLTWWLSKFGIRRFGKLR